MKRKPINNQRDAERATPGRHRADPTLYLVVSPDGRSRYWVQRITVDGKPSDFGLGGLAVVNFTKARRLALDNRIAVHEGRNPFADRKQAKAPTFADVVLRFVKAASWQESTRKNNVGTLDRHVNPAIGKVSKLTAATVINAVRKIAATSIVEARKSARLIKQVMDYAVANQWAGINPVANGVLLAAIPELKQHQTTHHSALDYGKVKDFLSRLNGSVVHAALRFLVLTGVRSNEATGATWAEVDFDAGVWTIPADRMKTKKAHRVPLSRQALATLEGRKGLHKVYVFPSDRTNKPLGREALSEHTRQSGITVHGFRSSFRNWAAETGRDYEATEKALSHAVGSTVERSYNRTDLLDARRQVMQDWADYVMPE